MSSLGGPSIVTSGLVLHLDAGNTKSYPGEETVNLIANPIPTSTSNFVANGGIGTSTYDSKINAVRWVRTSYETWGSYYYNSSLANYLFDTTATYSISFKWKYGPSHSAVTYAPYFHIIQANGLNTIMGNYVLTTYSTLLSDGWYYFKVSGTPANAGITQTGAAPGFRIITGSQSGITDIYWKNLQFEKKTYSTPFVNGTRGTTVETGGGWIDRSGNGNNGQILNGPTYDSSKGGSISFDGVNDYISTSYFGGATENYTFSSWVLAGTASYNFLSRGRDGSGNGWSLRTGFSGTQFTISVVTTNPSTVEYTVYGGTFIANIWYNITGVWINGVGITLYVNGTFISTNSTTSTSLRTSTDGWCLGGITTSNFVKTKVSNVKIYNRALTATEVLQNYNATKSRFI